tara:strand:- start:1869 stop:2726 length:858 start_codon:yes stop_codon:yes gene_type:complete
MYSTFPWHDPTVKRVIGLADSNRLPSAVVLTCSEGWGGEALLARCAAELLGIVSDLPPYEIAHPDFCWVRPDGAVIKIDAIRRLTQFAVQTPQISVRKVACIVDAHLMNKNSANALLKVLEEPPSNTHILLATPYWGRLMATVRSRCQNFAMTKNQSLAKQWLAEQGLTYSDVDLAEVNEAPLALAAAQDFNLRGWLADLERVSDPAACVAAILKANVVEVLGRWVRLMLSEQKSASDRQTLVFIGEINRVRLALQSSNSANAHLLIEKLLAQWLALSAFKKKER